MEYTTKTRKIDILQSLLAGRTASDLLAPIQDPVMRGYIGETILDCLTCCGIHPTDPLETVDPLYMNTLTRRVEARDVMEYITKSSVKSGGNKFDVAWCRRSTKTLAVCSSKIGMMDPSWNDLEVDKMKGDLASGSGYMRDGVRVNEGDTEFYALVPSAGRLEARGAQTSSLANRENVTLIDLAILDWMCGILRFRSKGGPTTMDARVSFLLKRVRRLPIRARLHQKLLAAKAGSLLAKGVRRILLGALPRSGKTYIAALLAVKFNTILIVTTRPTETLRQWLKVFAKAREYSAHSVAEYSEDTPLLVRAGLKVVSVVSMQYLKKSDRPEMEGLAWDVVLFDEIHEGGATELSDEVLSRYVPATAAQVMLTATYAKPVAYYAIPEEHCLFWDLEDTRLMRSWPECRARLEEKHGASQVKLAAEEMYEMGETDARISADYQAAPTLEIFTTVMQQEKYDRLAQKLASTSVYGFSMRSLLMPTKDGKAFQNPDAVHSFLQLVSGSNKEEDYPEGDMSMFARIRRHWNTVGHRGGDTFFTAICFLPYGVGQAIDTVKELFAKSLARKGSGMEHFAIMRLDAGMGGDMAKHVADTALEAKLAGKKGLLLLTGNVGSLGISLPEVDVAFLMHDIHSADMTYQQMMRVLTEALGKRCGIVVDFNVWRVLTTLNAYAVSRCGQGSASSEARIWWCVSNLVNIDADMWTCPETPQGCSKETVVNKLTKEWRAMVAAGGTTLEMLARTRVDIGEDQALLDTIASAEGLGARASSSIGGDQASLGAGIDVRSEASGDERSVAAAVADAEVDRAVIKSVNLNEVLARLIPEIAVLSSYEPNLVLALKSIASDVVLCDAFDSFMREFYMGKTETDRLTKDTATMHPFFRSLVRIVDVHHAKLTEARELYEIVAAAAGTLDNPHDLVEFLSKYYKPREVEKKKNGEVFTPVSLIVDMYGVLQKRFPDIWTNPSGKFFDPANGIGNFPAVAYHYLMIGLRDAIPDDAARKRHILENMLYMAEKDRKNVEVCRKLFNPDGNYKLNLYCGDSLTFDAAAHWGISMKDVHVIGNPPYNKELTRSGACPLYNEFIEKYVDDCRSLLFVVPSRWFAGGKGLDKFRKMMLARKDIYSITHIDNETSVFGTGVSIEGGVNYFLVDREYSGLCSYNGAPADLSAFDILMDSRYTGLVSKVASHANITTLYRPSGQYKVRTNGTLDGVQVLSDDASLTKCYVSKQNGYVKYINPSAVKNDEPSWKVITARANGGRKCFGNMFVGAPNDIHTDSYISFNVRNEAEANNLISYLKCKLPNKLLGLRKVSQDIAADTCKWIPLPPLDRAWTDASVNEYYGLTAEETALLP